MLLDVFFVQCLAGWGDCGAKGCDRIPSLAKIDCKVLVNFVVLKNTDL